MTMAKLVQGTPGEGEPVGIAIWLAFPAGLLVGMLGGAINGFLVTKVKLPPFIVTLGTFNVFLALTLTFTKIYKLKLLNIEYFQMQKKLVSYN